MTEVLCYDDSYLREFDAEVVTTTAKGVVLDRTAFYPGGGGQPPDAGMLLSGKAEYRVSKTSRSDGLIVHELDEEPLSTALSTGNADISLCAPTPPCTSCAVWCGSRTLLMSPAGT